MLGLIDTMPRLPDSTSTGKPLPNHHTLVSSSSACLFTIDTVCYSVCVPLVLCHSRLLGFRIAPPVVGRRVNLTALLPITTQTLRSTYVKNDSTFSYHRSSKCSISVYSIYTNTHTQLFNCSTVVCVTY